MAQPARHSRCRGLGCVVLFIYIAFAAAAQQQQAGQQQQQQSGNQTQQRQQACGGTGQPCCLRCPPEIPQEECDQRECSGGRTCHMFGIKSYKRDKPELNVCLQTPPECGKGVGQPCCFSSDPTSEAERCGRGLTCIVEGLGYGSAPMYYALLARPADINSTSVMGTCRNLTTQLQDCGKRFFPCGAAARRIGCPEAGVQCSNAAEDFCAAPSDTMLGASRCLPLPLRCGKRNNACCPGNTGGTTKAVWAQDGVTPIPYCSDNTSFCVWKHQDYTVAGLQILNEAGYGKTLLWDGYFQRGYGQSRCAPLPASCGNPGEPCCPSMLDQRLSGMVHNRRFRYQPCNYNAAGKVGIFCKGAWQGALLNATEPLGTCTLNTADCGKLGKQCCREDVPETGPVMLCESRQAPGTHYCTEDNTCTKCPPTPATALQRENCRGASGLVDMPSRPMGRAAGGPRGLLWAVPSRARALLRGGWQHRRR